MTLAPSTVNRLLKREGLLDPDKQQAPAKDRRRFAFREAGELWMSDVMHGPQAGCASADRRQHAKTYLIAFLDDATRLVPHAAFAFSENAATFLPVFKQALLKRGIPTRLSTLCAHSRYVPTEPQITDLSRPELQTRHIRFAR